MRWEEEREEDQIAAPRPKSQSLAREMASCSAVKVARQMTGPKICSEERRRKRWDGVRGVSFA